VRLYKEQKSIRDPHCDGRLKHLTYRDFHGKSCLDLDGNAPSISDHTYQAVIWMVTSSLSHISGRDLDGNVSPITYIWP
jgi:hypothetical protein